MGGASSQNTKSKQKHDLLSENNIFTCEYSGCTVDVKSVSVLQIKIILFSL